ncbi:MAG: delta-60 repeat domain-containing protein, partial [Chloroflexota bacterium]
MQRTSYYNTQSIVWNLTKLAIACFFAISFTLIWAMGAQANNPGDLDVTFGGTGVVTTSVTNIFPGAQDMVIQSGGEIVVTGGSPDFTVLRYTPLGNLDTSFNSTGIVTTDVKGSDSGSSIAIQSDDKIVVAGNSNAQPNWDFDTTLI